MGCQDARSEAVSMNATAELVETDLGRGDADTPRIAHSYCPVCNPQTLGSVITAVCGHVSIRHAGLSKEWPADRQICAVCAELDGAACPGCGR